MKPGAAIHLAASVAYLMARREAAEPRIVLRILLAAWLAAGAVAQTDFAGSDSCRGCHGEIARKQEASHHARTLRRLREAPQFAAALPFSRLEPAVPATLRAAWKEGALELEARTGENSERLRLEWAFGAGNRGITPVGRTQDGEFVEGRLSWYRAANALDLTPGAEETSPKTLHEALGKRLPERERARCFGCHSTTLAPGTPSSPEQMGVRCEACHGPGRAHADARSRGLRESTAIRNPGRLDGLAQARLCGSCHGNPPDEDNQTVIGFIRENPATIRFPPQRLVLSRCFQESAGGLRCTACHDPHENVSREPRTFDAACVDCHQQQTTGARICPASTSQCVKCHMLKRQVVRQFDFTDHWIRIH